MKKTVALMLTLILLCCGMTCSCSKTDVPEPPETEPATETKHTTEHKPDEPKETDMTGEPAMKTELTIHPVHYVAEELTKSSDITKWEQENALNNNACKQSGIIVSPYFTMTINGVEVPVFAERTARGAHNLAYVDLAGVADGEEFALNVEIGTHKARKNPVVLPENAGVTAAMTDDTTVTATITAFGSYTFTFDKDDKNDGSKLPLTLMVKPKDVLEIPEGYDYVEIEPGEYNNQSIRKMLMKQNTVYFFKRGAYDVDCIVPPSNSILYFEEGTLITCKPLTKKPGTDDPAVAVLFDCYGKQNVKILGRAAFDVSMRYDGMTSVTFAFEKSSNIEFAGMNIINSCTWVTCFTNCKDSVIRDLVITGYRTYSDGIMISDSRDITVSGCFVRTGDDGIEVKSTSGGGMRMKSVLFENNAVWTDKGIAYGAVYEANFPVSDVTWRNNSVGYALADWSDHLGCLTVSVEGTKGENAVRSDLHFENVEIYETHCQVFSLVMSGGGTVKDIYLENITAKYVDMNEKIFLRGPIDLMIKNYQPKTLASFIIGDLYFDNVIIAGEALTEENRKTMITNNFPPRRFEFDENQLKINTLTDNEE